jgi:putative tryptophan/tyrosine transport system substrate-binding protein
VPCASRSATRFSMHRFVSKLLLVCVLDGVPTNVVDGQESRTRDAARVVVLQGAETPASRELIDGFRRRLEQLGRRTTVTVVSTDGETAAGAIRAAATSSADLVLAMGSRATAVAASEFRGTPTIGALLTRQSALPSGSAAAPVVLEFPLETELEWMRRILPQARRIGVLYSTDENAKLVARAREMARGMGLDIIGRRVANPAEIPAALGALAGNADAIWGIPDDIVLTPETARAVLLASIRSQVPFVGLSAQWVRAGAVYALDRDYGDMGMQTADLAVRMLDGASARSIDAVRPRKVLYSLNTRSAGLMRLNVPQTLLRGASEVIR